MAVPSTLRLVSEDDDSIHPRGDIGTAEEAAAKGQLTPEGFDKFLFKLDPDRESAGRRYEVLRSKLINYFDWRNCRFPEEHADEALSRVMRKVEADEELRDASVYVFGVARMMLLEIARHAEKERTALNELCTSPSIDTESEDLQMRISSLRECLEALPPKSRELISEYYEDDARAKIKRRKDLAARLGMKMNALRIRACRLREKLEECMVRRMAGKSV